MSVFNFLVLNITHPYNFKTTNISKHSSNNKALCLLRTAKIKLLWFNTHRPTTHPSSSVTLLDLCRTAGTLGVPKKTAEEYTAIPDLPDLRTSYPGLEEFEDVGEEEIWTLWIPSKASMCLSQAVRRLITRSLVSLVVWEGPRICGRTGFNM